MSHLNKTSPGWIALDIDGTLTTNRHELPSKTARYLEKLHERGWKLLFVTGRIYSYSAPLFTELKCPYHFAVQNGADLFLMPGDQLISRNYLTASLLPTIEMLVKDLEHDFIIYAGYENGDFCYYRPDRFTPEFLQYLDVVASLSSQPWKPVDEFSLDHKERFSLIKCFGSKEEMEKLSARLIPYANQFVGTMIKDPIGENLYLNMLTHPSATKGGILEQVTKGEKRVTIGAGDDLNDLSLLQAADIAIAMEGSPPQLLAAADHIAPPASEEGIVAMLSQLTGVEIS